MSSCPCTKSGHYVPSDHCILGKQIEKALVRTSEIRGLVKLGQSEIFSMGRRRLGKVISGVYQTKDRDQDHPQEKEMQKGKMAV